MSQLFAQLDESAARGARERASADLGADLDEADGPRWLCTPLTAERHLLGDGPGAPALERTTGPAGQEQWLLITPDSAAGGEVRVNGVPVGIGVRALAHRDELRLQGQVPRVFFSDESLPTISAYPGPAGAHCPRCQLEIEIGDDAVCCPNSGCRVWHHQSAAKDLLCWTYEPMCALCDRETDLEGELQWVPEEVRRGV
jgi:hypothetical protein